MHYTYSKTQNNGDATSSYSVQGKFPIVFKDFMKQILEQEDSFRVTFGAHNECYGGWLGNRLEVYKIENKWNLEKQEPENWFDEIAHTNVTSCHANGGWGQMTYFCTFEE